VVDGARLSETANNELAKISALSEQLQGIMSQIRSQSEEQSGNAGSVRESMDRLNDLSKDFQSSVTRMVAGVQQIDASMGTLQSTVSIFTTEKQES
jgi:methyl-accepting chemotaxis protein